MKHSSLLLAFAVSAITLLSPPAAAADGSKAGLGPSFKGPLGLQLYSLRDSFKTNVPGTMAKVRDFGFRYAELAGTYGMPIPEFNALLAKSGIKAIASHFSWEQWRDNPEAVARDAKALGLKYAGCAWIPRQGPFDEKLCREAIAIFNRAGAVLKPHGIKFFYHVHGFEFEPFEDGTLFDLLMRETDPKNVVFEMDVFWVVFPGQDPVKLFQKYGKRWQLMHLKDMKKGLALGSLSGGTDVRNNVPMGQGQIDMPAVLRAARKAGVKWYFIEDESPTVEDQIPLSLRYLEAVRF
ncbi:MAG: sugar phosphate isomerase/epimerase family protein [Limisphaerales bacterium]